MTRLAESPDAQVAAEAVQALTDAHQRALAQRRGLVLVKNGELVRIGPSGQTLVLKKLSPRRKVTERVKRVAS